MCRSYRRGLIPPTPVITCTRVDSSFTLARARQCSTAVHLCPVSAWSSLAGREGIIFCKQMMRFKQDCSFLKIYIFAEATSAQN